MSNLTHNDLMHTPEDRAIMGRARAYLPNLYVGHNPNEARQFTNESYVAQVMLELDRAEVCKLARVTVPDFIPTFPNGRRADAKFEGYVNDGGTEQGYAIYSNVALS